jgi:predicted permease
MSDLLYILEEISLPIILLIASGYVFQKIFHVDVRTFAKLTIYFMIPVVIFYKLYSTDISGEFFTQAVPFILLLEVAMYVFGILISALLRFNKSMSKAFTNSLVLINTGNYGIPLIDLVFRSNPLAATSQIFIIAIQNITSCTVGVFLASSDSVSKKRALINIIKMPALYTLLLVVIVKLCNITVPEVITKPLGYISDAFVAFALIGLGVQLAEVKFGRKMGKVMLVSTIKVIIAPLTGFALALLLNIQGILGAALIIGLSTPSAVNSATFALEFGNEPEFAAQVVFMTTVLCTFSLPLVIYFVRGYFGVA